MSDKGGGDPNAGQTERRSRSTGTLNTRSSSPLLYRRPTYTTTCCDSVPLSDSGRALSVLPNHDHCRRHCDHPRTISCPNWNQPVSAMFPPSFQFLSELFTRACHAWTTQCILTGHTSARMVHAHLTQTITHGLRTDHASAIVPTARWILHFRVMAVQFSVLRRSTGMSILCGWIADRTLYPYAKA